jgi:L-arabinokinase
LLRRLKEELSGSFDRRLPIRISRAPGRLDVMGGITDYCGGTVCLLPLERATTMALQRRSDRNLQLTSFNLLDSNQPFTLSIPLDALATSPTARLRADFAEPSRRWAGYVAGCLHVLHRERVIDLANPAVPGLNLAILSNLPSGAGVSSSAALAVATMLNLVDELALFPDRTDDAAIQVARLCQMVENEVVGAACGIMDQVACSLGHAGQLLRLDCRPHTLLPPIAIPEGVRLLGINSNVSHTVAEGPYAQTRCAAFMAHKLIVEHMKRIGAAHGRELESDPLNGYLATLDHDDYRRLFRYELPERMTGRDFLALHGNTIDNATVIQPEATYFIRAAADHHVLDAQRVRNFCRFLVEAGKHEPSSPKVGGLLDRAGHTMYGSHLSYSRNAGLGHEACDALVRLVQRRERRGLYGARITGGGCGGTVVILAARSEMADDAIREILSEYERTTGNRPEWIEGSSPGGWWTGTDVVANG